MSDTRALILETATRVFAERGFEPATVDDIATAAAIAKGTIYYHFKSKEDILFALLEEGIRQFTAKLEAELVQVEGVEPRLRRVIEVQVDYFSQYRDFCRVLLSEIWRWESHWKRSIATIQDTYLKVIKDLLEQGTATHALVNEAATRASVIVVFNLIALSSLDWAVFHPEIPREEMVTSLQQLLLHGILV